MSLFIPHDLFEPLCRLAIVGIDLLRPYTSDDKAFQALRLLGTVYTYSSNSLSLVKQYSLVAGSSISVYYT